MMIKMCATLLILLSMGSLSIAQGDEIQMVVDNLEESISASIVRSFELSNRIAEKKSKNVDVPNGKNTTIVTCTGFNGKPQNVKVRGLTKNIVIVNCQTDKDGNAHITTKMDSATRGIGGIKIQGDAENIVIINNRQLGVGSEIVVEGKNAKASVGNVEVNNGKLNKSVIINSTTIKSGRIEAKGDGANVSVGTVTIGD